MISEIVVGSVNGPNLIETSFSELQCFRRCQMKHHYRYIMKLEKKTKDLPLERGSVLHLCLEAFYKTGEWKPELKKYKKKFNRLFEEERELYGDLPAEVFRIMRGYCNYHKNDRKWKVLGVEVPFKVRLPNSRVVLEGYIDLCVEEKTGIWVVEHKTHKDIPSHDYRMMDVQPTLYYYVAEQHFGSDVVMGCIYNYLRTKPPTVPKLLKSGKLSKAKIDTDRATYLAAIKKHGLDRDDYEEVLSRLSYRNYFRRERIPKPEGLVRKVIGEAIITGHLIEPFKQGRLLPARTFIKSCLWDCEFLPLCYASLHGHDVGFLIKNEYRPREGRDKKKKEV